MASSEISLGVITLPALGSQPVSLTSLLTAAQLGPNGELYATCYWVQHLPTNKGDCYGGDTTLDPGLAQGIFFLIPAPSAGLDHRAPFHASPFDGRKNPYNVSETFIAGTPGDQFIVSCVRA